MAKYCQQQFKAGWYEVGGKKYYFRSGLEVRWARYLQILKETGEIEDFVYEPQIFWFKKIERGTNNYKPDFKVIVSIAYKLDGKATEVPDEWCWHEVKGTGILAQKDVTKFRRMHKYYPEERMVLVIQRITKKNKLLVDRCRKYVVGVIEAEELLKKNGM